jgi:hypothetical protein
MAESVRNHASPSSMEAAQAIGAIFLQLKAQGRLPNTSTAPFYMTSMAAMLPALYRQYGSDNSRLRQYGNDHYVTAQERYREAHDAVVPELAKQALAWSQDTLNLEAKKLHQLLSTLRNPSVQNGLCVAAQRVWRQAVHAPRTEEENQAEAELRRALWSAKDHQMNAVDKAGRKMAALERKRYAAALRKVLEEAADDDHRAAELLAVLFAHPAGVTVIEGYNESVTRGAAAAGRLVQEAFDAVMAFGVELIRHPDHVWRYEPLLMGGLQRMRLIGVPGMAEYVSAIGVVKSISFERNAVFHLGLVLGCLGLVFSGPVGLAVIGALELGAAGYDTALTYMEEREQELAAAASGFRGADEQIAASSNFEGTKLAGATALLTAIALFAGSASMLREMRARQARASVTGGQTGMSAAAEAPIAATAVPIRNADEASAVDPAGISDRAIQDKGTETTQALRENTAARGIDVPDQDEPFELMKPWEQPPLSGHPVTGKRDPLPVPRGISRTSKWLLSMEDQMNHVQFSPKVNAKAFRTTSFEYIPEGGATLRFGPREYILDSSGQLVEASTTRLTLGVRDPAYYRSQSGGKDFGHLLGILFGHMDAQLGPFGGFPQARALNQFTGRWFRAEQTVHREALKLQELGRAFRVVAQARDYANGIPAEIRIFLEVGGQPVPSADSGWIRNI